MRSQGQRGSPVLPSVSVSRSLSISPPEAYTYQWQQKPRKNTHEVETPPPPKRTRYLPHHYWRYERAAEKRKIGQRHAFPALVHTVQIAHAGVHQRFERTHCDALQNACP